MAELLLSFGRTGRFEQPLEGFARFGFGFRVAKQPAQVVKPEHDGDEDGVAA